MRMVAWVGGRKSPYTPSIRPYTSECTAVYSEVYGKNSILLQYFKYIDKYLKKVWVYGIGFVVF